MSSVFQKHQESECEDSEVKGNLGTIWGTTRPPLLPPSQPPPQWILSSQHFQPVFLLLIPIGPNSMLGNAHCWGFAYALLMQKSENIAQYSIF